MTRHGWIGLITGGMTAVVIAAWTVQPSATVQVERAQVTTGPVVRQVLADGTVESLMTDGPSC